MGRRYTGETKSIEALLREHFPNHSQEYPPEAYRYDSASIRVRLVDTAFKGKSLLEREQAVLPVLKLLPKKTFADLSILLVLTPAEVTDTFRSLEFDNPTPSPRLPSLNGNSKRKKSSKPRS